MEGFDPRPLVKAGVRVDGIELSQDMVDWMREKPDSNNVTVTMGDMSRVHTGRTYGWSTSCTTRSAICSCRTTRSDASRTPPIT